MAAVDDEEALVVELDVLAEVVLSYGPKISRAAADSLDRFGGELSLPSGGCNCPSSRCGGRSSRGGGRRDPPLAFLEEMSFIKWCGTFQAILSGRNGKSAWQIESQEYVR